MVKAHCQSRRDLLCRENSWGRAESQLRTGTLCLDLQQECESKWLWLMFLDGTQYLSPVNLLRRVWTPRRTPPHTCWPTSGPTLNGPTRTHHVVFKSFGGGGQTSLKCQCYSVNVKLSWNNKVKPTFSLESLLRWFIHLYLPASNWVIRCCVVFCRVLPTNWCDCIVVINVRKNFFFFAKMTKVEKKKCVGPVNTSMVLNENCKLL